MVQRCSQCEARRFGRTDTRIPPGCSESRGLPKDAEKWHADFRCTMHVHQQRHALPSAFGQRLHRRHTPSASVALFFSSPPPPLPLIFSSLLSPSSSSSPCPPSYATSAATRNIILCKRHGNHMTATRAQEDEQWTDAFDRASDAISWSANREQAWDDLVSQPGAQNVVEVG